MASWAGRGRRRAREERGHSREGMYAYLVEGSDGLEGFEGFEGFAQDARGKIHGTGILIVASCGR